jgi:hypothetical protein
MLANDSRGNTNLYNKFYQVNEEIPAINETFKGDMDTGDSFLFGGLMFFALILFIMAVVMEIPVLSLFSGLILCFQGVILIFYSVAIGSIIIGLGVIFAGYTIKIFNQVD